MSLDAKRAPHLSIVLPCYNEARNLAHILARFAEVRANRAVELVLVNNGSTDDSAEVLARELADKAQPEVYVVTVPVNRGYGHGILTGLRAAHGEFLAWTHADLQTDLLDVIVGLDRLEASAAPRSTLLRGRRLGRAPFDAFFTWGMGVIATLALGVRLHDVNAQPKLFHRSLLERMQRAPDDFSLDLYVLFLARQLGWSELEHPVNFGCRRHGEAKGGGTLCGKIKLIRRTLRYVLELRSDIRAGHR
jgi:glycosyltransferase involved in cell wall biosynthesis